MTTKGTTKSGSEISSGLNAAAQTAFTQTVLEPPAPSARLRQAAETYQMQRTENLSNTVPDH